MRPALRLAATPRSASDATRFTATTLHATSKTATPPPRFSPPRPGAASSTPGGLGGSGGSGDSGDALFETPEQKVARLRAAHERAKAAQVSKFDAVVDHSRRFFDSAHKITVVGLIGFTGEQLVLLPLPLLSRTKPEFQILTTPTPPQSSQALSQPTQPMI